MIWLASYPRSGNTFLRNLIHEAFGMESSSYHHESYKLNSDFQQYPFVKTHLLPEDLPESLSDEPSIYIVRDGRDTIVSMAHHRKDFVASNSNLMQNMSETILASNNSHFGGWSQNTFQWIMKADLIIRFEDLIQNPRGVLNVISKKFQLPIADFNKIPSFEQQQKGEARYGASYDPFDATMEVQDFSMKFFRSGKVNGWKKEMPSQLQSLFWDIHGDMMEKIGYFKNGSRIDMADFPKSTSAIKSRNNKKPKRVLVEATKAEEDLNDGIKRYVHTLLKALAEARNNGLSHLDIKVKVFDTILTLDEAIDIELKKVLKLKRKEKEKETNEEREEKKDQEIVDTFEEVEHEYNNNWFSHLVSELKKIQRRLPKSLSRAITLVIRASRIKVYYGRYRLATIERNFRKAINIKFDLIHYTLPQILDNWEKGEHHLVTMHDITHLNFSHFHEQNNIDQAEIGFQKVKKHAPFILSVSKSTLNDLQSLDGFKGLKKRVVYEAIDHHHFHVLYDQERIQSALEKFKIWDSKFLLCLATNEPRKNIKNTISGFLKLIENYDYSKIKLVVGGKPGWKSEELIEHPNIIYTGYVLDEDLCALYNAALGFCYISHYEGFGLPPLEAMRCGTVPIYGNNSAMTELIQDAGLSTDPTDIEQIRSNMEILVSEDIYRRNTEMRAYERSMEFTISKMAKNTLDYYSEILSK